MFIGEREMTENLGVEEIVVLFDKQQERPLDSPMSRVPDLAVGSFTGVCTLISRIMSI